MVLFEVILIVITAAICIAVRDIWIICGTLCACIVIMFLIHITYVKMQEKRLSELILYLSMVQDGLNLPELKKIKEGQLGILQSEIYKVVALLGASFSQEKKRKKYMSDMLSDISHQIKTPITAVGVMTDLLEAPGVTEEKRLEYVGKIDKQVSRISWLIKNLLTLSQLEADVIELKKEKVNLAELILQISETVEILAEVKNVGIEINVSHDIELICDRHWTMEALSNIIKNCVEHTNDGGNVWISAKQDNIATHIHIKDNGEGIGEEHLPHIFERFYKADNASSSSVGIGLAMSKQIIMKQNGIITVKSKKDMGTDFYVKIYM